MHAPSQFECAVPEVRREHKKVVYDIILKRAGMSWLAVSKRYSECRRFHSRLMTSEVVTQMECRVPEFPEIKMPFIFNKSLTWEKRREGLNRLFSLMFREFTRECFFSPLLISFFGGDISNIHISENHLNQAQLTESQPGLLPSPQTSDDASSSPCEVHHTSTRKEVDAVTLPDDTASEIPCSEQKRDSASALDIPIDIQGELWYQNKQTGESSSTQWKKRFFTTDSGGSKAQLYMWKDNSKFALLNSLDLSDYRVEHVAQPTLSMLGFGSKTPGSMVLIEAGQAGQEIIFRGKSNHEVSEEIKHDEICTCTLRLRCGWMLFGKLSAAIYIRYPSMSPRTQGWAVWSFTKEMVVVAMV